MYFNFNQRIRSADITGRIFITSDLHFYHKGILGFCPDTRPWSTLDDMTEGLIAEWNSLISPEDSVLHLGDFSFKGKEGTEAILERLNGDITFLYGNHDKALHKSNVAKAYDYLELRYNGTKLCLSHYPISCWNQCGRGSLMLHGHTHGSFTGQGRIVDVGYDHYGKIMLLDDIVDELLQKDIVALDHHDRSEKKKESVFKAKEELDFFFKYMYS